MNLLKSVIFVLCLLFVATLYGCGGGGGGGGSDAPTLTLTGVAASGAPLVGTVTLKDSSNPTRQLSTSTASDGSFSFNVSSLTAPFLLKATGTSNGISYTFYSLASSAGVCNINPLTHLAVNMANSGEDMTGVFTSPTPVKLQTLSALFQSSVTIIQGKMASVFTQFGASSNFVTDMYSVNHQGLDLLFDVVSIVVNNGNVSATNRMSGQTILPSTSIMGGVINGTLNTNMMAVYTVSGSVKTSAGSGVSGVSVTATGTAVSPTVKTDMSGNYKIYLPNGAYSIKASLNGYTITPVSIAVTVSNANIVGKDFTAVSTITGYTVSGTIKTASATGIPNATVSLVGTTTKTTTTDSSGNYSFSGVMNGSYTVNVSLTGYTFSNTSVTVNNGNMTGQNLTGTQTNTCSTLKITPTNNTFPAGIGVGTVTVEASSSCQWTPVVSSADWLTANSFFTSSGGTVNYSLSANASNSSRIGQLYIGPQIFTVNQSAQTCLFSIFPSANFSVSSSGSSGSVQVTASSSATGGTAPTCPWTAVSNNPSWIIINGANSGSGNGTVSYSVAPYTGANKRTGTMTIAGQTYTVTQAGVGVTGTWSGPMNMPGANYPGCIAQTTSVSLYLSEDANSNITGSTSNGRTITSGIRNNNQITVSLNTMYGARGPYTWTWNGTNTITGSMAYFCYNLDTNALISEGTETFSVTRY